MGIKIGTHCIKIGEHCVKIGTSYWIGVKIGTNFIKIGPIFTKGYLYRYVFWSSFGKIGKFTRGIIIGTCFGGPY